MDSYTYVVIGASAASIAFMNKIVRLDAQASIICISQEPELPYNKCFLADYCAGLKAEDEVLLNTSLLKDRVTWLLGTQVIQLDVQNKRVMTADRLDIGYQKLFLGMGSGPFIPPFARNNPHIYTFHTLQDTNRLLSTIDAQKPQTAIIIGAGLSGIECADALHKKGISVTLIEQKEHILPSILDAQAAEFLQEQMRAQGVTILTHRLVACVDEQAQKVFFDDQSSLHGDLIVVTTGLRPHSKIAVQAGIALGALGGILVDEYLQTSHRGIYAGGDLIETTNSLTGQPTLSCTWPDAMFQGMMAACVADGKPGQPYKGTPIIVNSAFFGLNFTQAGIPHGYNRIKKGAGFYHAYSIEGDQLKGFCVLGNVHDFVMLKRMILTRQLIQDEL